jgi:hypothetical protein
MGDFFLSIQATRPFFSSPKKLALVPSTGSSIQVINGIIAVAPNY